MITNISKESIMLAVGHGKVTELTQRIRTTILCDGYCIVDGEVLTRKVRKVMSDYDEGYGIGYDAGYIAGNNAEYANHAQLLSDVRELLDSVKTVFVSSGIEPAGAMYYRIDKDKLDKVSAHLDRKSTRLNSSH
jgi:hypothetical protein